MEISSKISKTSWCKHIRQQPRRHFFKPIRSAGNSNVSGTGFVKLSAQGPRTRLSRSCYELSFDLVKISCNSHSQPAARRHLYIREFYQRRRQRDRQNSNRFIKQINRFAGASRFSVYFLAVTSRLRRENA